MDKVEIGGSTWMPLSRFSIARFVCLLVLFPGVAVAQELVQFARSGDLTALQAALPEGSEPDPDKLVLPLYFASQRGNKEIVTYLLSLGANADSATDFGTALGIAARNNSTEIVESLLAAGANPNLPGGEDGKMPLHHAAERGALGAAQVLVDNGADVNAVSTDSGFSAVHFAASKERTDMVAFLKDAGAAPAPVDALSPGELEGADIEKGRLIAIECGGCHNMAEGATDWHQFPAPNLFGVVDRPKASLEGFPYSKAMRSQSGRWTVEDLNVFLADPYNVIPGTTMSRGALTDRASRVAIIAHLNRLRQ